MPSDSTLGVATTPHAQFEMPLFEIPLLPRWWVINPPVVVVGNGPLGWNVSVAETGAGARYLVALSLFFPIAAPFFIGAAFGEEE